MRATITGILLETAVVEFDGTPYVSADVLLQGDGGGYGDIVKVFGKPHDTAAGLTDIPRLSLMTAEVDVMAHRDADGSTFLSCMLHGYAACPQPQPSPDGVPDLRGARTHAGLRTA